MIIKHSTSIFISRFGLVYKIVLYFLIVCLVVAAISIAIIAPSLTEIFGEMGVSECLSHFGAGFDKLFHGNGDFLEEFRIAAECAADLGGVWSEYRSQVILCAVTAVVALFVTVFLLSVSFLPFSDIIANFMSSKSDYGFLSNLVVNAGSAVRYALLYTFTIFVVSLGIFALSMWILVKLVGEIGIFGVTVAYLVLNLLLALRSALIAGWLPAVVVEKCGVAKGFSVGLRAIGKHFPRAFWTFFFLNLIAASVIPLFGLFTFGIGFVIAIPSAYIIYRIAELVLYYDAKGYRYYLDERTVIE